MCASSWPALSIKRSSDHRRVENGAARVFRPISAHGARHQIAANINMLIMAPCKEKVESKQSRWLASGNIALSSVLYSSENLRQEANVPGAASA